MAAGNSLILVPVSASLMCCDGDGKQKWEKEAGRIESGFGCGCKSFSLAMCLAG